MNSARLVDIILDFEDAFDIEVEDEDADAVNTVGDAVQLIAAKGFLARRSCPQLPFRTRAALTLQREVGRFSSIVWIPPIVFTLRVLMRYRIKNAAELRKRYRASMMKESEGPVLICANHLTMVDSAILAWALGGSLVVRLPLPPHAVEPPRVQQLRVDLAQSLRGLVDEVHPYRARRSAPAGIGRDQAGAARALPRRNRLIFAEGQAEPNRARAGGFSRPRHRPHHERCRGLQGALRVPPWRPAANLVDHSGPG